MSLELTHTHTHTHAHTHSRTVSHFLSPTHTHTHIGTLKQAMTHSHTPLELTHPHTLSLSIAPPHTHTLTHSHTHCRPQDRVDEFGVDTHSLKHTHTRVAGCTTKLTGLEFTHSHPLTLCLSLLLCLSPPLSHTHNANPHTQCRPQDKIDEFGVETSWIPGGHGISLYMHT